ncbi:hypothetical protein EYZ11_000383 [Aspergillus tanneri]|uniref:O-methylsterigmatocystin oxidoreductase n=1 Tax=Aspergillus tanneri TaxID=1220188 RepID=A0A4S3JXC8_9EURO|nr:hypothetical protein EYZ11_000383 [Aspergillus tanneri]
MALPTVYCVLLGLTAMYLTKLILFPKQRAAPLPPGPKPRPIIGNLGDLPPPGKQDWQHWWEYKERYGPISSINIFGKIIIIVNDFHIAHDLLEKHSSKYNSRPQLVFAGEMLGLKHTFVMHPYSDLYRPYRKIMNRLMGSRNAASQFNPLQHLETRRFLLRVLEDPTDIGKHAHTEAGAVILKIAYGYTIEPHSPDPLVNLIDLSTKIFSLAATPGMWLVDTFPFLRYVPSWFPGAKFKRTSLAWRKILVSTAEKPFRFVQNQMRHGSYPPSYVASLLESSEGKFTPDEINIGKWTAASLYAAGVDTTTSSVECFFLAMALYPEVQAKAQEELDRVLGPNRLPTLQDRENLPYIDALVRETFRWHPVTPMAGPHLCSQDEIYKGYLIPKGAVVLPNLWTFTHDETIYKDPMSFNPERFLGSAPELDPHSVAFGFGRRMCPGRLLADNSLFGYVAQSLTVFNISREKGSDPKAEFLPGVISHPAPYPLKVTPRSEDHEKLIRMVESEHPWEESNAKDVEGIVC